MSNKDNFALPTPQELAKKARETTIPVSFRIKESTHAMFSSFAKQYKTTVGALINELLDCYASQYNNQLSGMIDINDIILDDYINKKAIKLSKDNNPELFARIIQSGLLVNYDENPLPHLTHDINGIIDNNETNFKYDSIDDKEPKVCLGDCFNTTIIASKKEAAKLIIDKNNDSKNEKTYILEVPAAKWGLISAILCSYVKKFVVLYGCKEASTTFLINERTLRGIEAAINKKMSNSDTAKRIAKHLEDFKESDD